MIFVTLGSQKFQFNRLLESMDNLIQNGKITEKVFAQIGSSEYTPRHYEYKDFIGRDEFAKCIDDSDIVITHGGTGVIINAVKKDKKVIAIPRLAKYGEHVDDHQIQLLNQFEELNMISACYNLDDLEQIYASIREQQFNKYYSNTRVIIKNIENFVENK